MKLLVITNDFPPTIGGIENLMYSLVRRWAPEDVVVLTRWVADCERFDGEQPFEVVRMPVGTLLPTRDVDRRATDLIESHHVDVVHFASSLPLGMLGPRLRKRGVPYAVSVHGGEFLLPSRLPLARQALKRVAGRAAVLLAQSSASERLIRGLLRTPFEMERVTCGVDFERYGDIVDPIEVAAPGPVLVSVSRLVARKGPATTIRALPAIRRKHPGTTALIVGGGPDIDRLRRLALENDVEDAVIFAGPQPWSEIPRYLAAGDVFVLPTRERFGGIETEGLPLAYVEAAAAGLPLVGGRAGGVGDAVRDGETGFLVDGRSADETADAVIRILDDSVLRETLGRNARKMAENDFNWEVIFERYEAALGRTESNDGALDPRCCWRFPSIWSAFCFATGLSILFRRSRRLNPETIQPRELRVSGPVEALSGSFMLATRDVWQSLGGFDERFFMYGEDIDICMKAKSLGFHRTFVESASAEHAVGASSHADADKMVLVLRGKVTFARKHWPPMRATVYIVFLGIGVWVRACGERILRPLNLTHSSKWRSVFRARDLWRPGYPTRDRT